MVKLTNVEATAAEYSYDLEKVKDAIKSVQSLKCRLTKQKAKAGYEAEMRELLAKEQLLKEVRSYIEPKKVTFTTMTWDQIQQLNYDETIKAIKSVQSKKCNTQYATADLAENVEYQQAIEQEKLLLQHKANIKPIDETVVKKSSINDLIAHLETLEQKIDKEYIIQQLQKLIQE